METVVLAFALFFLVVFIVTAMMMTDAVSKKGVKVNFFLIRLFLPRYISQYRRITREETGKTGPLFFIGITSINLALILFLLYVFLFLT